VASGNEAARDGQASVISPGSPGRGPPCHSVAQPLSRCTSVLRVRVHL